MANHTNRRPGRASRTSANRAFCASVRWNATGTKHIFAEVGFFAAMKISTYEEMSQVNTYILLPMSFLCGTFFTTQALPGVLRVVIEALPLTHTSMLLRSLAGGEGAASLSLLVLMIYAFAGFYLSRRAFARLAA